MTKLYRNTYALVNVTSITSNVQKIVNDLKDYKYHIAVVKADCYAHQGLKPVKAILKGNVNYLAVATLKEALFIRKYFKKVPILCLGIIDLKYLHLCKKKHITVTISNLDYVKNLKNVSGLKVHIKLNTGMNRLGINNIDDLKESIFLLQKQKVNIEGIYTHIYNDENKKDTLKQCDLFSLLVSNANFNFKIIHIGASGYLYNYPMLPFVNGARFGIAMYGLLNRDFKSTFSLYSEVIQINEVNNETVGYGGKYASKSLEYIAVVPIGYADGIIRENTGRYVYINDKRYQIVGNICMDMLFIKVDKDVHVGDKVILIKDNEHLLEIAKHLNTISYEVMCMVGKRVPRIYIK